jgi:hypothetical protein
MGRVASRAAAGALSLLSVCSAALGKEPEDSDDASVKPSLPNVYLDLRTIYTTLPANTLAIGFSAPPLLATLSALTALPTNLSSPSSRGLGVDIPLTIDLNDRISVYGGISATTSQSGIADWTQVAITSWNIGVEAEVYQQNGGKIPTVTIQSTLTRSIPDAPLATTSLNTVVEAGYALNEDETRGFLAGVQYTQVMVDTPLANVNPNVIGYAGGYYQWDNNWKLTGRFGVQAFGGAQLLNLVQFAPFTQPIVRIDLDRMDDDDNRRFGITAQIAWTPKPSYQLTIRTPLYLIKN